MSKSTINFKNMNNATMELINDFADARIAIAKEDIRHKKVAKELGNKLTGIIKNRENDLAQGLDRDEVLAKHSTVEVENAIRAEQTKHEEILEPLNNTLKDTYVFIPETLYDGYVKKVNEGKRGDYLIAVGNFIVNLGIESPSQSAINKLSETIADRLGVRVSTSKKLLEDGCFSSEMKKNQFNKLFISVFCDILVQHGVITVNKEEKTEEKKEDKKAA